MQNRTIGLVLTALLPVAALVAFLFPVDRSGWVLAAVCALLPAALYLMASPGRGVLFPVALAILLLTGLGGVLVLSGAGKPTAALVWMILVVWLAPLALVGAHHVLTPPGHRGERR